MYAREQGVEVVRGHRTAVYGAGGTGGTGPLGDAGGGVGGVHGAPACGIGGGGAGLIARAVEDLDLALRVIAGADAGDPGSVPAPIEDTHAVRLDGLRVAWYVDTPGATPTPATIATVERAARSLEALGCTVEAVAPPRLDESLPITQTYWKGSQSTSFDEWRPPRPSVLTAEQIERGRFEWERFSRDMAAFMRGYDVVLAPVAPRPAPLHDTWTMEEYLYTLPYSLTGQPVVVLPFGLEDGLPIGVQVIARKWCDHVAIAGAVALESSTDREWGGAIAG